MIKPLSSRAVWLAGLSICVVAVLLVAVGCTSANQAPVISSLSPSTWQVSPVDSIEVWSVASDPDGDELSYTWSASAGDISGEGSVIFWTAPEASGTYTISVKVIDGKGGETTQGVSISVASSGGGSG